MLGKYKGANATSEKSEKTNQPVQSAPGFKDVQALLTH